MICFRIGMQDPPPWRYLHGYDAVRPGIIMYSMKQYMHNEQDPYRALTPAMVRINNGPPIPFTCIAHIDGNILMTEVVERQRRLYPDTAVHQFHIRAGMRLEFYALDTVRPKPITRQEKKMQWLERNRQRVQEINQQRRKTAPAAKKGVDIREEILKQLKMEDKGKEVPQPRCLPTSVDNLCDPPESIDVSLEKVNVVVRDASERKRRVL